jgi:hypothetical protein
LFLLLWLFNRIACAQFSPLLCAFSPMSRIVHIVSWH